ncbi:hypothetical protein [Methylobacterium sp. CM6246]
MARNVRPARRPALPKSTNDRDVFINCPFDPGYKAFFFAIVWTVVRCGFLARCALEYADGAQNRLEKIKIIISECRYAVHDISRTESNAAGLPRFNMPLELGLWYGAHHFGGKPQEDKRCIVFDREPYRFPQYISDIGGQDVTSHGAEVDQLIVELTAWLRLLPEASGAGGGQAMVREYHRFERFLPRLSAAKDMRPDELLFGDYNEIVSEYVAGLRAQPGEALEAELAPPAA